jgi:hypothetical protein
MYQATCAENGSLPPSSDYDPCESSWGYLLTPLADPILTN